MKLQTVARFQNSESLECQPQLNFSMKLLTVARFQSSESPESEPQLNLSMKLLTVARIQSSESPASKPQLNFIMKLLTVVRFWSSESPESKPQFNFSSTWTVPQTQSHTDAIRTPSREPQWRAPLGRRPTTLFIKRVEVDIYGQRPINEILGFHLTLYILCAIHIKETVKAKNTGA